MGIKFRTPTQRWKQISVSERTQ